MRLLVWFWSLKQIVFPPWAIYNIWNQSFDSVLHPTHGDTRTYCGEILWKCSSVFENVIRTVHLIRFIYYCDQRIVNGDFIFENVTNRPIRVKFIEPLAEYYSTDSIHFDWSHTNAAKSFPLRKMNAEESINCNSISRNELNWIERVFIGVMVEIPSIWCNSNKRLLLFYNNNNNKRMTKRRIKEKVKWIKKYWTIIFTNTINHHTLTFMQLHDKCIFHSTIYHYD